MQRVGFERMARGFFRGVRQRPGAEEIDDNRHHDYAEGPDGGLDDVPFVFDQALDRFPDHYAGEQEQQRRFGERRDRFDFAVAVVMFLVGWLSGDAHGDIGHDRGAEVDQRMSGFRQDRQRARGKADQALATVKSGRSGNRGEGDLFFFGLHGAPVYPRPRQISRTTGNADSHSVIGFPSAAAERVTASRMRILASNCSVVKR